MEIKKLVTDILSKNILPTKILKKDLSIEVIIEKPLSLISLHYTNENQRDIAWAYLDKKTFAGLTFNPYVEVYNKSFNR